MTIDRRNFIHMFNSVFPRSKNAEELTATMFRMLEDGGIDTEKRLAAFLAQCGHESSGFSIFEENLNYSAKALATLFPRHFKNLNPDDYARQPEKIANVIYSGRMGNYAEGDGWKYRGRGIIQLTGRENYAAYYDYSRIDVVKNPDLILENVELLVESALWFWKSKNLNVFADKDDIKGMTKRINGGYNGLASRESLYRTFIDKIRQYKVFS